jgi:dolichol-phosphate mannosyltransferase
LMIKQLINHFWQPKYITILKFCVVGFTGIIVNNGLLYAFTEFLHLFYLASAAIAVETSVVSNFIFHDIWTFKEDKNQPILKRFGSYQLISLIGIGMHLILLFTLVNILNVYYIYANIGIIPIMTTWNFLMNRYITWKK